MEILTKGQPEKKHRLIILTDMENEPDDSQTMVKLLRLKMSSTGCTISVHIVNN